MPRKWRFASMIVLEDSLQVIWIPISVRTLVNQLINLIIVCTNANTKIVVRM